MDHSAHAMAPAEAANPGMAPAPAPVVAPVENKQPVNAAAVTGHTLPIDKIKNFKLADQNGKAYELYKMTDAKAIVLTMHTKGCPIGQQLNPDFHSLQAKYEAKGVKFLMINPNTHDTPEMIAKAALAQFDETTKGLHQPQRRDRHHACRGRVQRQGSGDHHRGGGARSPRPDR